MAGGSSLEMMVSILPSISTYDSSVEASWASSNNASALFWTSGVWLLYEGRVDDFLVEVKENSYFLTLIARLCCFVLTIAEGNDYGRLRP